MPERRNWPPTIDDSAVDKKTQGISTMRAWFCLSGFLATVPLAGIAWAQASPASVQRCESADKRVTYSNTECPPGTAAVRTVNTDPPVKVEDREAARQRTRSDTAAARQAGKEQAQQDARDRRDADQRSKLESRTRERCERAQRALGRAKKSREDLGRQAATVEKMQKADAETRRREAEVANDCPR
jgi:hypothetical protein